MRTTRIRNYLGQVYILRNGDITSITNFSKGFIYAAVTIGVDYDTNLDIVEEIVERVGHQLQKDCEDILEPTQVEGIEEFGDIRLSVFTITKVKPGRHVQIKRILRQVLKEAFDREGIYIPIGEMADKPDWVSKTQQEQNRRHRNQKPKVRRMVNNHYITAHTKKAEETQYQPHQQNGKQPLTIDESTEEPQIAQESNPEITIPKEKIQKPTDSKLQEKTNWNKSIEETAQIIEKASQKAIIPQAEESATLSESTSETQGSIIHELEESTIEDSAMETPAIKKFMPKALIPQDKKEKAKKATNRISKQLKDNLKKFLKNH